MNTLYFGSDNAQLEYDILAEIMKSNGPVGASLLALTIDSSQATIGRKLNELENRQYLVKLSNKGRTITEQGRAYFHQLEDEITKAKQFKQLLAESTNFSPRGLLDILHVRRILERETTVLAAGKVTKAGIADLEKILAEQEAKVEQGFLGDEEDLEFHRKMAHFSGNGVLEQLLTIVLTQRGAYSGFSYIRNIRSSATVIDHKMILQAIRTGDTDRAGDLMVAHIDNIINDVSTYFHNKQGGE